MGRAHSGARPDDTAAIVAIGTVGFARVHEPLLGTAATRAVVDQTYSEDAVSASIARCAAAPDAHFLVAERDDRVVGYVHYDSFAGDPELHRIYLDPDEIGRGTGSALLDELHAWLRPDDSYIVMTAVANETACRFYERHGLTQERRISDGNAFYRERMESSFPPTPHLSRRSSCAEPANVDSRSGCGDRPHHMLVVRVIAAIHRAG